MKDNKWNLISAILFIIAGVLFIMVAAFQTSIISKCLFGVAAVFELISGIRYFYIYIKIKKEENS